MAAWPYNTTRWRRCRRMILERDGYRCQLDAECDTKATEVDHIVPLAAGGAPFDPTNLRAACKTHNASAGATLGNQLREPRSEDW